MILEQTFHKNHTVALEGVDVSLTDERVGHWKTFRVEFKELPRLKR
jgi:hypothetical protein